MDSVLCDRPNTEPISEGGSGLSSKAPILKRRILDEVEEAEESSVRKAKIAKTTSAQTLDRILEMQEKQNENCERITQSIESLSKAMVNLTEIIAKKYRTDNV